MEDTEKRAHEIKYKSDIETQVEFFVQKGMLGKIRDFQTVSNWIQQFPHESLTPYFLIDALIVVDDRQIEASLRNILEQIKASIYKDNPRLSDEELLDLYYEHLAHSEFVCACLPGKTASGAPRIMHELRNLLGAKFNEAAIPNLCADIQKRQITHIYIVDDFVGTGSTIKKILNHKGPCTYCHQLNQPATCSLKCIATCHPDVDFSVISVVMHTKGKNQIKGRFRPLTAYTIDEAYNLLSPKCKLYRDEHYRETIVNDIQEIMNKHQMGNPFALYLPICISDGFPNNTLELFWWADSPEWRPLLPRQH